MRRIQVEYDGCFPNTCSGTLLIIVDGEEIYHKQYCCSSTGSVWFDDDWGEHVEDGELLWNDAHEFPQDVQQAVADKLSECRVCCGGCV